MRLLQRENGHPGRMRAPGLVAAFVGVCRRAFVRVCQVTPVSLGALGRRTRGTVRRDVNEVRDRPLACTAMARGAAPRSGDYADPRSFCWGSF